MIRARSVSVYEFSDHVRVALQLTYLIDALQPRPNCTLYLRSDCKEFMQPTTTTIGRVRYLNKYLMTLRFWIDAAVSRRKVLISTGPESASTPIKRAFSAFLRTFRRRISIFIIVRDLKPERGRLFLQSNLYSLRSVLAVESDALQMACSNAGYLPQTYMYPTPISARLFDESKSGPLAVGKSEMLTILLTGSLDSIRRDYDPLFTALPIVRTRGFAVRIVVGGHCQHKSADELLAKLKDASDELIASALLSDAELDAALLQADALVCLNRPEFYGGIKGSGAIGDAFFAGKKLLIHDDLTKPHSNDARFYASFNSGETLAGHLLNVAMDRHALQIPLEILHEQSLQFSAQVSEWLKR